MIKEAREQFIARAAAIADDTAADCDDNENTTTEAAATAEAEAEAVTRVRQGSMSSPIALGSLFAPPRASFAHDVSAHAYAQSRDDGGGGGEGHADENSKATVASVSHFGAPSVDIDLSEIEIRVSS
jgi:hypothetical protein